MLAPLVVLKLFYSINHEKVSFNYKIDKFFENLIKTQGSSILWRSIFSEKEKVIK